MCKKCDERITLAFKPCVVAYDKIWLPAKKEFEHTICHAVEKLENAKNEATAASNNTLTDDMWNVIRDCSDYCEERR
jgi:hypothetical protein